MLVGLQLLYRCMIHLRVWASSRRPGGFPATKAAIFPAHIHYPIHLLPQKSIPALKPPTRPPIPRRAGRGGASVWDFLLPVNIRMEVLCGLAGQDGHPFSVLTHFLAIYYILEVLKRSICAKDYLYGQEGDRNAD